MAFTRYLGGAARDQGRHARLAMRPYLTRDKLPYILCTEETGEYVSSPKAETRPGISIVQISGESLT
jgi:hypothetical protein